MFTYLSAQRGDLLKYDFDEVATIVSCQFGVFFM